MTNCVGVGKSVVQLFWLETFLEMVSNTSFTQCQSVKVILAVLNRCCHLVSWQKGRESDTSLGQQLLKMTELQSQFINQIKLHIKYI